jgi:acyl carrier protein
MGMRICSKVYKAVESSINNTLGVRIETAIDPDTLLDDLGIDSLDIVEIMLRVEDELDVTLEFDHVNSFASVLDVVDLIKAELD